jgi:hypothetical protein
MTTSDQRARAMAAGCEPCPFCELGWRGFSLDDTKFVCVNCGEHSVKETFDRSVGLKMSEIGHARAMEQKLWQCPQCDDGWQQYLVAEDRYACPSCGYAGGPIKSHVGMGVICHVGLRVDTPDVRAAHSAKYYECVEKVSKSAPREMEKAMQSELMEYEIMTAALDKIHKSVRIATKTLLQLSKLSEIIKADDDLEIRMLLCYASKPVTTTPGAPARSKGTGDEAISDGSSDHGEAMAP